MFDLVPVVKANPQISSDNLFLFPTITRFKGDYKSSALGSRPLIGIQMYDGYSKLHMYTDVRD